MQTKKFRLNRAITKDAKWIFEKLSVISKPFGTKFSINQQGIITLK
jgi:poly-gamma-glutamate capsule biosynthesis protein CapA/YwtB (metallophosphatase superfamily)